MHRSVAAWSAACCLAGVVVASHARGQDRPAPAAVAWNDARTRELLTRGIELRRRQLADTGLANYAATAHGYLTFLAQVGEGFPDPPRVVKADELAHEVYWRAPNYSKQLVVGRRDTLLLPTDINYHRDHLGIVQNNFPNVIRLGDGDEVRDVPHPVSALGEQTYDYRISDSLRFQIPGRTIDVYEVKVRPKDDRSAAVVGAVYLARDDAQIVRMAFSFTRAALLDTYLEDVSIVLENSLQETRFWLPRRQEIEIRRTGTWLEFPARGIIRGRWEICCYQVNGVLPPEALAPGMEIALAPPSRRRAHRWQGAILDSLPPEVRAATDEDVARVQAEARALVRAAALARSRTTTLAARRVSDLARIDRAEGLSLGTGVRRRVGHGLVGELRGRYGFSDHEPKGAASLSWEAPAGFWVGASAFREYRNARDVAEASGVVNSIAAQEFGTDYTEPFDTRGFELAGGAGAAGALRWRLGVGYEWTAPVPVTLHPANGTFEATIPALRGRGPRASLRLERPPTAWAFGTEVAGRAELRWTRLSPREDTAGEAANVTRLFVTANVERPFGKARLVLASAGGFAASSGVLPAQEYLFAGGPVTAPGAPAARFAAEGLFAQRLEWQFPVRFPSLPLGRWGRSPAQAVLAPFAHLLLVQNGAPFRPDAQGAYPSVGLGVIPVFGLLRVDVARSFRDRRWSVAIDVGREFWGIL
jgi:hypothetical protein